jgi:hypothetical protein
MGIYDNQNDRGRTNMKETGGTRRTGPNWAVIGAIIALLGVILLVWAMSPAPDGLTPRAIQAKDTKSPAGAAMPDSTKRP